jgi:transmembrane sensor
MWRKVRRVGKESPMNSNKTEIEAGEWLARLDRENLSAADLTAFDRWRAMDPRNAAAYARLAATWQALDRIRAIRPSVDQPIDDDFLNGASRRHRSEPLQYSLPEAAQQAVADSSLQPRPVSLPQRQRQPHIHRPWFSFSVAASLLLVFAGFWIAHTSGGPHTFSTGIGGFQRIVLDDLSVIEINTNSEVRVALTPQLRKVELVRGEASFEVAHDVSRPFIVSAGNTAVRAVGTKFDVHRLDNSVEVTVDEGKVAIGTPSLLEMKVDVLPTTIPQLSAGQTAIASGSGVKLKNLLKNDLARKLAWQNQMLVFDGDSLADVVAQFNRYNARQLVIAEPKLAALEIGGYFRPTNLNAFIDVLQSDFGIRVNADGNRLLLVTDN